MHLCSREHRQAVFVLPGAQASRICGPGSTNTACLCSREHKSAVFVLPGAHSSDTCAPGSTNQQYLCSREHKQAVFVLTGADLCSREHKCCCLCSREHKWYLFVLPGVQMSPICAPGSTNIDALRWIENKAVGFESSGQARALGEKELRNSRPQ